MKDFSNAGAVGSIFSGGVAFGGGVSYGCVVYFDDGV